MSGAIAIEEAAARWILKREEPGWTEEDQAELDAWLGVSMAHKAAYWRLEHGWRQADRIASLGSPQESARQRRWWPAAIAASLAAAVLVGTYPLLKPPLEQPAVIASVDTPIGVRKLVPLRDGSKIELNTATAIRTAVSATRREVWLDRGEAYFEVAHNPREPFVVHTGSQTVTVLGTKFSVRRDGAKVTVSVLEGRVRIDDAAAAEPARSTVITAGDVAISRGPSTLLAPRNNAEVERHLAWRSGTLRFERTTLGEAVAEFNRYNRKQIIVEDPATAGIEIGGTFQANNADAFVRLLRDAYGLKVRDDGATVKISS